jgi:uncharacterized protein (DUF1330 family)
MTVTICARLWAHPGGEQLLFDYENRVLALLERRQGKVLWRGRALDNRPCEIQILEFASVQALVEFQNDPERRSLTALRDQAIAQTEVISVEQLPTPG